MKTILITGGAGFIGSNLAESLLGKGYFVIVIDNLQTGFVKNISHLDNSENFTFIQADVNNYKEIAPVFFHNKVNFVFHYAAMVGVQHTLANPLKVLNDIEGIKNILSLSKSTGVERIFYSSSSEVYGENMDEVQNEDHTPLNSRLPYAAVKNIGEIYLKTYKKKYGLNFTIFRFFNTYGPKQSEDFVVAKFINQALCGKPITINGDGKQSRTFCYIGDNIRATTNALESAKAINQIINIGSNCETSVDDLAKAILRLTGSASAINYFPPLKEGDMRRRRPDIGKMKKMLGMDELISLDEGIKKTIEWQK